MYLCFLSERNSHLVPAPTNIYATLTNKCRATENGHEDSVPLNCKTISGPFIFKLEDNTAGTACALIRRQKLYRIYHATHHPTPTHMYPIIIGRTINPGFIYLDRPSQARPGCCCASKLRIPEGVLEWQRLDEHRHLVARLTADPSFVPPPVAVCMSCME